MCTDLERFTHFLQQAERSPHTIANYLCDLRTLAAWFETTHGEPWALASLTPTDLRDYKRWLISERRLKGTSINRHLATVKSFLRWARETGLLMEVHAGHIPSAEREYPPGPRWLGRREQHTLVRAVERGAHVRDLALVQLLLHTGLRVQEVCTLLWQDVIMSERQGTLTVTRGKGGVRRHVPLNQTARRALLTMGYHQHAGSQTPIFLGQRGPLTPRGVQMVLAKYTTRAGLDKVSPHTLRHTFCKNLVDAGVGLERVAALAGHVSLDTTRRYCLPSLRDLEKAVELLNVSE